MVFFIAMKECPSCKSLNADSNTYCKDCGKKFHAAGKSNAFRNFLILVVVFVVIIALGLVTYSLINNNTLNRFDTLFQKYSSKAADQQNVGNEENISLELKKEELGPDQKRLTSMFGYPDQFIIIFDEGNNTRIDSWMYEDMEACFIFEDGKYSNVEEFIIDDTENDSYNIAPEDFTYAMTPEQVEKLISEKGTENIDESTGLKVLTFGDGIMICVFNPDNCLINIARQKKISTDV